MSNTSTPVVYGLTCERTPKRTAALTALVYAVQAHRATLAIDADGSGWDIALYGERAATARAVDALINACAAVLPPGQIGGELIAAARRGAVPGLDEASS